MLVRVFCILSFVAIVAESGESPHKPKTTASTKPPPTTTTESTTTPLWTQPPTYPVIYPRCCGKNEVYLPPGIAPHCNVYCNDIGKECQRRYDITQEPHGCYCLPGFCVGKNGDCISFYEAFIKCL